MARGTLAMDATHVNNVQFTQDWTLDPTGNWNRFLQSDVADPSANLDQSRWQNAANEITRIARRYGADWATPAYAAAGNMTSSEIAAEMTAELRLLTPREGAEAGLVGRRVQGR